MTPTWEDFVLWIAGTAALGGLFGVMLFKGRARQFPFFTTLVGFDAASSVALYLVYSHARLYNPLYYTVQVVDFLLQLAVVAEIARKVFKPFGKWAAGARSFWIAACGLSLVLALGMTFVASPHAPTSTWAAVIKGELFAMMFTCMISIAVLVTARRHGLAWRDHVIGLAQGWTFWAFVTFAVTTCQSYLGFVNGWYIWLDHVGVLAGISSQIYWITVFWREEPSRSMSLDDHKILIDQQKQLDYYVDKLVSRGGTRRSP
jgi:hypothetical protein